NSATPRRRTAICNTERRLVTNHPRRRVLILAAGAAAPPALSRIAWTQTYQCPNNKPEKRRKSTSQVQKLSAAPSITLNRYGLRSIGSNKILPKLPIWRPGNVTRRLIIRRIIRIEIDTLQITQATLHCLQIVRVQGSRPKQCFKFVDLRNS